MDTEDLGNDNFNTKEFKNKINDKIIKIYVN